MFRRLSAAVPTIKNQTLLNTEAGISPSVGASVRQRYGWFVSAAKFSCDTVKKAIITLFAPKQAKPSHIDPKQTAGQFRARRSIGIVERAKRACARLFYGHTDKKSSSASAPNLVYNFIYNIYRIYLEEQYKAQYEYRDSNAEKHTTAEQSKNFGDKLQDNNHLLREKFVSIFAKSTTRASPEKGAALIKKYVDGFSASRIYPDELIAQLQRDSGSSLTDVEIRELFALRCRNEVINEQLVKKTS